MNIFGISERSTESDYIAQFTIHIIQTLAQMLECCTGLHHPVICSKSDKRKVYAVSLCLPAKKTDLSSTEETRMSKIKMQSLLAKGLLDSLTLKDISTSYTPLSPPTLYLSPPHPAPLYHSQSQRASRNSSSAAYKIGSHVSLWSRRDCTSLG